MGLPTVIVLGLSPTGLYAVRELGRAGFRVIGVTDGFACGRYSKYLAETHSVSNQEQLLDFLLALRAEGQRKLILLPTNDRYIEFLCKYAENLSASFAFAGCYREGGALDLMDKLAFSRLCQKHGLEMPVLWEAAAPADLVAFASQIRFPCILKPALIHRAVSFLRGQKVLIARDRTEFERHIAAIPEASGKWLVQEIIPGPESNITVFGGYFDRSGTPRQTFTGRKLRQYPPGFGSASLARSETCRKTLELSLDFLGKVGFRGVCGTEFKRDPRDGRLKIIEINPRPTLWFALTHAAGKRIVETACLDLAGLPYSGEAAQLEGVFWRYAFKDFYSSVFYRRKSAEFLFPPPEIGSCRSGANGRVWAVFDSSDPLPALMEPLQFIGKLGRRL